MASGVHKTANILFIYYCFFFFSNENLHILYSKYYLSSMFQSIRAANKIEWAKLHCSIAVLTDLYLYILHIYMERRYMNFIVRHSLYALPRSPGSPFACEFYETICLLIVLLKFWNATWNWCILFFFIFLYLFWKSMQSERGVLRTFQKLFMNLPLRTVHVPWLMVYLWMNKSPLEF